jgi:hypothetical protein
MVKAGIWLRTEGNVVYRADNKLISVNNSKTCY